MVNMKTIEKKNNNDGTFTIVTQCEEKLTKFELQQRKMQLEAQSIDCINQMRALKIRYEGLKADIKSLEDMIGEQTQELPSIPD